MRRSPRAIRQCAICGKDFPVDPSRPDKKYCSTSCYSASKRYTATCQACGKEFSALTIYKDRKRYCSKKCKHNDQSNAELLSQNVLCIACGKEFSRRDLKAQGRNLTTSTCSQECGKIAKKQASANNKGKKNVTATCVGCGQEFTTVPSRRRKYCSRQCTFEHSTKGKIVTSEIVTCIHCGKTFKKFKSRATRYPNNFCGSKCYHAWDKEYKSTPEMLKRMADRIANGDMSGSSRLEDHVSDWLTSHRIPHERQSKLGHYITDFKIGDLYLEINGCYWHGCPEHYPEPTSHQKKRQGRDRSLAGYAKACGKTLVMIWEHEIAKYQGGNMDRLYEILAPHLRIGLPLD